MTAEATVLGGFRELIQHREYVENGAYHRNWKGRLLNEFRYEIALKILQRNSPEGRCLDLGGGDGVMSSLLLKNGFRAIVFDIDRHAILLGKGEDSKIQGVQGGCILPFASNRFSAVTLLETLEHIKDDRSTLEEISRVLKPNGILVLSVPSKNLPVPPKHYRHYSEEDLLTIIEQSGLITEQILGWKTPDNFVRKIRPIRKVGTALALVLDILVRKLKPEGLGTRICDPSVAEGLYLVAKKIN